MRILCDFDGTITTEDIGDLIFDRFCDDEAKQYALEFYNGAASLEIDKKAYASIQSGKEEILQYVKKKAVVRAGFFDFLHFVKENGHRLTILSGGYDFYIKEILGKLSDQLEIVSNKVIFKQQKEILNHRINPECKKCGNCKKLYCQEINEEFIYIGDSISDICAVNYAKTVFARHRLKEYLHLNQIPFIEFETFFDIIEQL